MIPVHVGSGKSGAGALRYVMHDQTSPENPRPDTSDRVDWTVTLGSPTSDVDLTMRIMQGVVADAPIRKALSGHSARGRRTKKPYDHFVFAWRAGERPTQAEMTAAVEEGLQAAGIDTDRHPVVLVAHRDTEHRHVHAIALRIDPFTGLTAKLSYSGLKLSAWAERYELEHHGALQVPRRAVRRAERSTFKAAVDEEMADFQPTPGATPAQARKQRGRARKQTRTRLKATKRYPLSTDRRRPAPWKGARTPAPAPHWKPLRASGDPSLPSATPARKRITTPTPQEQQRQRH